MKKAKFVAVMVASLLVLFSCASTGPTEEQQDSIETALVQGNTMQALAELDAAIESYSEQAVYDLDYGMLSFYNGDYENAIAALTEAEGIIENNRITSITEGAAGLIANDNVKAYSGANYEDLYLKGVKALAYYAMGDYEGSMVEIRRANIISNDFFLNPEEQSSWIEDLVLAITPDPFSAMGGVPAASHYSSSAFINYLSMLMYAANGDSGNARIDFEALEAKAPGIASAEDYEIPMGMARVNFLTFDGIIADKEEASAMALSIFPLPDGPVTVPHKVSWPVIPEYEGSQITGVKVTSSDGQTVTLGLLEDVSDAARENLNMDLKSKYLGSFYRGYTKMSLAVTAAVETYNLAIESAEDLRDEVASQGGLAALGATAAYNAAVTAATAAYDAALNAVNETEIPDLRMARFLPDQVMAGGLTMAPGTYDFTVEFYAGSNVVSTRTFTGVQVSAGRPNVVFASCAL